MGFGNIDRGHLMSLIKGTNTKLEILVRKFLFANGFRYRVHDKKLPGKPDIVLPKHKTVVFVNGCFWHRHPGCKDGHVPDSNSAYWNNKLNKNIERDLRDTALLISLGWKVIVAWECELKKVQLRSKRLNKLIVEIKGQFI